MCAAASPIYRGCEKRSAISRNMIWIQSFAASLTGRRRARRLVLRLSNLFHFQLVERRCARRTEEPDAKNALAGFRRNVEALRLFVPVARPQEWTNQHRLQLPPLVVIECKGN